MHSVHGRWVSQGISLGLANTLLSFSFGSRQVLGGHLPTHTKHVWGSQAFVSKASWTCKALIECTLRNALGSHIWPSSIQTSQGPASCGTSTLSTDTAELYPQQWLQARSLGQSCTAPGLAPLVQLHTGATQQCLTSWGMTGYTTSPALLEFAVLSLNIKENLLWGTKQAVLLCNAVQQPDILAQMYTIYNPKENECTIVQPNTFSWKQHLCVIFLGLYQLHYLH